MSAVNFTDPAPSKTGQLALAESLVKLADYGVSRRYHAMKIVAELESVWDFVPLAVQPKIEQVVNRLQTKFGRLSEKWPEPEYILSPKSLALWLCRRKNVYDHFLMIRKALCMAVEGVQEPTKLQTGSYQHISYRTAHTPSEQTFMEWMIQLRILKQRKGGGYETGDQVPDKDRRWLSSACQMVLEGKGVKSPPFESISQKDASECLHVIAACQLQWPPVDDAPQLWRLIRGGWLLWDLDLCWPLVESELKVLYADGRGMERLKGISHA